MIDIVIGTNEYLKQSKIDEILKTYESKQGPASLRKFDTNAKNFSMDQVLEACTTVSLFEEHTSVVLYVDSLKKDDENLLMELLKQNIYEVNLIVNFIKKPLASSALGKVLKNLKIHQVKALPEKDVNAYIKQEIKKRKINIDSQALSYLLDSLGKYPQRLDQELNKLELYGESINLETIKQIVSPSLEDNIFALSDAVLKRDVNSAFEVYHDLIENNVEPLALMGLVSSSFRRIYQISALKSRSYVNKELAEVLSMSEKQVYFLSRNRLRPYQEVHKLLSELSTIDQDVKLGKVDRYVAFELWLYQACI